MSEKQDPLLTDKEAAEYLDLKPNTLQVWRCEKRKDQPPYIKVGRNIRYRLSELNAWLDSRTIRH